MARTYGGLFPRIRDFAALLQAHRVARRGKRDRREVQAFEQDLEGHLFALQRLLDRGEYRTAPYRVFWLYEPKPRQIAALPYPDRVLQQALVAVCEPLWEPGFDPHSYACRPGRGMHRGADYAQHLLRQCRRTHGRVYVLKGDIAQYFRSVDHARLFALLARRIRCTRTLDLCAEILDSARSLHGGQAVGIPIGNRTSQLWANVYLDALDREVRHRHRVAGYARYMDDFVIIHPNKAYLHAMRRALGAWLEDALGLRLNAKTQVFPVALHHGRGLDFLGYHLWPTHRRLRLSSIQRMDRSLRLAQAAARAGCLDRQLLGQQVASWQAHASRASTAGLQRQLLDPGRWPGLELPAPVVVAR